MLKRLPLKDIDYYPLFVDYDFRGSRPRGASAYIDFFALGRLTDIVDAMGEQELLYVQKGSIEPVRGFFLADLSLMRSNPLKFRNILEGMQITAFFVEYSKKFPFEDKDNLFEGYEVNLVSFIDE